MVNSTLLASSELVKTDSTSALPKRASLLLMPADPNHPIVKALTWIIENRVDPSTGKHFTRRGLARAAGLKTEVHVQQILAGYQRKIEASTAIALARAGDVKVHWLLTHEGPREPFDEPESVSSRVVAHDEQHPNLADATQAARLMGYSEDAIERVKSDNAGQPDQPVEMWVEEIKLQDRKIKRGLPPASGREADELGPPPGLKGRKSG